MLAYSYLQMHFENRKTTVQRLIEFLDPSVQISINVVIVYGITYG